MCRDEVLHTDHRGGIDRRRQYGLGEHLDLLARGCCAIVNLIDVIEDNEVGPSIVVLGTTAASIETKRVNGESVSCSQPVASPTSGEKNV